MMSAEAPPPARPAVVATTPSVAAAQQASSKAVLVKLFAALENEDHTTFNAVTTPDFRAFEGGKVFDRDSLMSLIQQVHKAGKRYRWSITDERVDQDQRVAVINYVNKGTISDGGTEGSVTWLEVATFRATPDGWKINFLSSQRVAAAPKTG